MKSDESETHPIVLDPISDAVGFVLAGGRSSRMGADKALVSFRGQPLVVHALRIMREAGFAASIAGARSPLQGFAPVVPDMESDRGPLGGICAALATTDSRYAVFLPVDLPLLPAALLKYLLDAARRSGAAAAMASMGGFAQTFPVVIDRAVLPYLRQELEFGGGGCFSGLQTAAAALGWPLLILPVESISLPGPALPVAAANAQPAGEVWFLNLNSPADLEKAEACSADEIA